VVAEGEVDNEIIRHLTARLIRITRRAAMEKLPGQTQRLWALGVEEVAAGQAEPQRSNRRHLGWI
jgi:hypothetical protein